MRTFRLPGRLLQGTLLTGTPHPFSHRVRKQNLEVTRCQELWEASSIRGVRGSTSPLTRGQADDTALPPHPHSGLPPHLLPTLVPLGGLEGVSAHQEEEESLQAVASGQEGGYGNGC